VRGQKQRPPFDVPKTGNGLHDRGHCPPQKFARIFVWLLSSTHEKKLWPHSDGDHYTVTGVTHFVFNITLQ
jgi:hypothetical protein